jgi:hypothetical protein
MRLVIVEFSFDDPSPRDEAGIGEGCAASIAGERVLCRRRSQRARPPAQKLVAQAKGAVIMQRRGASKELCRSRGCTLPEFRSTGFCANHAAAIDVVAAVDAELAAPDKGGRARARRKTAEQKAKKVEGEL